MSEILLVCLMVLVVIGNTSGRWTKKSEEDPKDLKNEKENMKEVFAHWQENSQNKRFTTTTSTSTMPPTTPTTKIPQTSKGKDYNEGSPPSLFGSIRFCCARSQVKLHD